MPMSEFTNGRRIFLKGLASAMALATVAARKVEKPITFDPNKVSVLLGPAFDGLAEFSIVHSQPKRLSYFIYNGTALLEETSYTTVVSEFDNFKIDKFLLQNLPTNVDLTLKIFADTELIDERLFTSIYSNRNDYKIGLLSCIRTAVHDSEMWQSLEGQKSDLLLFLGDSVYVDYQVEEDITPKIIWGKFVESRMVIDFYKWKRLVPVIALWDDHDFGGDNSTKDFRFAKESQINFKNFFAQSLSERTFITPGPGISCYFKLGKQLFFMLDGRSFRENPKSELIYSMFGKEQEEWLFSAAKDFDGLLWLCNGTQWFNNKGYGESFRKRHAINFNVFIEKLNQLNAPAVFASGDVHYSEILETPSFVNKKSLELTSSSMHSSYFFGLPAVNPAENRIASTWQLNYMICSTQESLQTVNLDVGCYTRNRRKLFGTQKKYVLKDSSI